MHLHKLSVLICAIHIKLSVLCECECACACACLYVCVCASMCVVVYDLECMDALICDLQNLATELHNQAVLRRGVPRDSSNHADTYHELPSYMLITFYFWSTGIHNLKAKLTVVQHAHFSRHTFMLLLTQSFLLNVI